MSMSKSLIAKNAQRIMTERGYKQKKIAENAGFSPAQFSAMMNGRKRIDANYVPAIAQALGVSPNELFLERPNIA